MIIFYICLFFFGASLASFINATIYRSENNYSLKEFLTKPSHCENCNKELTWYELFPIFGFIFTKGKCIKCKTKINPYYPISEFILGISFLLFYIYSVPWYLWIFLISFFILTSYDLEDQSVPKNLVHIFIGISVAIWILFIRNLSNLLLPTSVFVFFSVLNMIKKSMGLGDLLMLFAVGILLSSKQFFVLFWIGIFIAFIYSMGFLILKKVDIKKATLPMIPFFGISFVTTCLYGDRIYEILLKWVGIW